MMRNTHETEGERKNQNIIGVENIHKYAQMRDALKKSNQNKSHKIKQKIKVL